MQSLGRKRDMLTGFRDITVKCRFKKRKLKKLLKCFLKSMLKVISLWTLQNGKVECVTLRNSVLSYLISCEWNAWFRAMLEFVKRGNVSSVPPTSRYYTQYMNINNNHRRDQQQCQHLAAKFLCSLHCVDKYAKEQANSSWRFRVGR